VPEAATLEQGEVGGRAVGGIGPHIAGGVIAVEHRAALAAVMRCRVRHAIAPQKAVLAVNADMIFVPEHRHRDLDLVLVAVTRRGTPLAPTLARPASVAVDLAAPRRLPVGRHPAAFEGVLLGLRQARSSRLDHCGIDDLPAHRQPTLRPQQRVEPGEQPLRCTGPRQLLAIKPDRLGIGYRIMQRPTDIPHERQPVSELIFGLVVRQRVQSLQHQNLKHQHCFIGRPTTPCSSEGQALSPIRARQRCFQIITKHLKIDDLRQPFQWIARRRQRLQPLVAIEKPACPANADPPIPLSWIAYSPRKSQWFLEPSKRPPELATVDYLPSGATILTLSAKTRRASKFGTETGSLT
jgi:hypothetical protein